MATFYVGQRVKRIKSESTNSELASVVPVGWTGTVTGAVMDGFYPVQWDQNPWLPHGGWASYSLAPLTDPKADAFLESIRKMATKPATLAEILHAKLEA